LTEYWFQIGQGTRQGSNRSSSEFNLYAQSIVRHAEKGNIESMVTSGRRIINLRYADDLNKQQNTLQDFLQQN